MAQGLIKTHGPSGGSDIARVPQLAQLSEATRGELQFIGRIRRFSAGQVVLVAGEASSYFGCVVSGFLRMQKTLADGRQHIVSLLVEGDMFGLFLDGPLSVAIEAATDAEVLGFRRGPFEELLSRSGELERAVLMNTLSELDRARDWMVILSNPRITGRVAGFLLVLCTHYSRIDRLLRKGNGSILVHVPISRTDIAHLLGARPESISRAIHALADRGCIVLDRPDAIRIVDVEALAGEAGEEDITTQSSLKELVKILRNR